jgi:hypothetical protein
MRSTARPADPGQEWPNLSETETRLIEHLRAFGPTRTEDLHAALGTPNISAITLRLNPKLERAGRPERVECLSMVDAPDPLYRQRRLGVWMLTGGAA